MSHLAESSDSQLKLGKAVLEFDSYIRANTDRIPNCGERRRAGETISTSFVESTVNQVVSKRMVKKQQMRWSPQGTHLFLQVGERDKLGEARGGRRLARAAAGIPASCGSLSCAAVRRDETARDARGERQRPRQRQPSGATAISVGCSAAGPGIPNSCAPEVRFTLSRSPVG